MIISYYIGRKYKLELIATKVIASSYFLKIVTIYIFKNGRG